MFKKTFLVWAIVLAVVVTGAACLQAQEEDADTESFAATIRYFEGDVEVMRSGMEEWGKAEQGQLLNEGDTVKTLAGSTVEMSYESGAVTIMEENSEMTIQTALSDHENDEYDNTLNLLMGKVLVNVEKVGQEQLRFRVETPVAVAAVRGTEFIVDSTTGDDTTVAAFSGKVRVKKKGMDDSVFVTKNKRISINKKTIKLKKPVKIKNKKKYLDLKNKFIKLKKKAKIHRTALKKIRLKKKEIILKRKSKIKTKRKSLDLKR